MILISGPYRPSTNDDTCDAVLRVGGASSGIDQKEKGQNILFIGRNSEIVI